MKLYTEQKSRYKNSPLNLPTNNVGTIQSCITTLNCANIINRLNLDNKFCNFPLTGRTLFGTCSLNLLNSVVHLILSFRYEYCSSEFHQYQTQTYEEINISMIFHPHCDIHPCIIVAFWTFSP